MGLILESDVLVCGVVISDCSGSICNPCECDVECVAVDLIEVA